MHWLWFIKISQTTLGRLLKTYNSVASCSVGDLYTKLLEEDEKMN
jgi:hypothetical protein